ERQIPIRRQTIAINRPKRPGRWGAQAQYGHSAGFSLALRTSLQQSISGRPPALSAESIQERRRATFAIIFARIVTAADKTDVTTLPWRLEMQPLMLGRHFAWKTFRGQERIVERIEEQS